MVVFLYPKSKKVRYQWNLEKKTPEEEKKLAPAAEQKDEPKPEEEASRNKQIADNPHGREDTGNKQTACKMRFERNMVEVTRFELATPASRTQRFPQTEPHLDVIPLFQEGRVFN